MYHKFVSDLPKPCYSISPSGLHVLTLHGDRSTFQIMIKHDFSMPQYYFSCWVFNEGDEWEVTTQIDYSRRQRELAERESIPLEDVVLHNVLTFEAAHRIFGVDYAKQADQLIQVWETLKQLVDPSITH